MCPFLFGDKVKKVEDTKEYKARVIQVFIDAGITLLVIKILAWTCK